MCSRSGQVKQQGYAKYAKANQLSFQLDDGSVILGIPAVQDAAISQRWQIKLPRMSLRHLPYSLLPLHLARKVL